MQITGVDSNLLDPKKIKEMMNEAPADSLAAQAVEEAAPAAGAQAAAVSSGNVMARNFASADREQSRYVEGALQGMRVQMQMGDSQQSALTSIMHTAKIQYEAATSSGEKYQVLARAKRGVYLHEEDEVRKSSESHLKKTREELAEKAVQTDESGSTVARPAAESASESPAPAPETAASAPTPAPAPEPAQAATPDASAAPAASTPSTAAPETPSVNITV